MSDVKIARRYAQALFEIAVEEGCEEAVQVEITRLVQTLADDGAELFSVLRSPLFSAEERSAVLGVVLPRLSVGRVVGQFLRQLSERSRMELLPDIGRLFTEAMDARSGRVRVQVSTTEPLTPQLEQAIQHTFAKATGKQVVLDARIDPTLIGGLVARVGDKVYDASIRTRLQDIKHRLINAPAAPEA